MALYTRRTWMQKKIALTAAAASALSFVKPSAEGQIASTAKKGNFKLAWALDYNPERLKIIRQVGVNNAIAYVWEPLAKVNPDQYVDTLKKIKADFESAGFTIVGVEGHSVPAGNIMLGTPGRDEEIINYSKMIEALGKVGIPMCCYNFMAGIGWYRTRFDVPERGGAMTSEFDYQTAEKEGLTQWGKVSEEKIWDNLTYFLKRIIPVAEKAGVKMALHPDDPPISPLRGIGRVLTSADAFRRVMDIVPSPVNGIAFCQANFKAMGEDIEATAREFCEQGKVFFVHFRDIEGRADHFHETFHDNGPTDMARMLRVYYESGFDGPIRSDHAPTIEGESEKSRGYGIVGKVIAIGYMKGLMDAQNIPYQ